MSGKPRLLIVSGSYPRITCGVAGHVRLIAERTEKLGLYDISVLTSADEAVDVGLAQGYRVLPRVESWSLVQAKRICELILAERPDIVHIQNPTARYVGWRSVVMSRVGPILKKLAPRVRLVVMQHDIAVGRKLFQYRYYPLLHNADAVVVSNSRDEQAVRRLGVPESKLYRAPVSSHFAGQAPTAEDKLQARAELGIAKDAWCVSYFGFIHPGRHIDVVLRGLAELKKRGRSVFGIMMGGAFPGADNYYHGCQKLGKELGLAAELHWTGYASEEQIAQGLAASDIFVSLPGRGADMRNTSLQTAMLARLPVVTSENPRYYIDSDLRAMGCECIRPGDAGQLCEAIEKIIQRPPSAEMRARRAAFLEPEKVWARHIEVNLRAYQDLEPLEPGRFEDY